MANQVARRRLRRSWLGRPCPSSFFCCIPIHILYLNCCRMVLWRHSGRHCVDRRHGPHRVLERHLVHQQVLGPFSRLLLLRLQICMPRCQVWRTGTGTGRTRTRSALVAATCAPFSAMVFVFVVLHLLLFFLCFAGEGNHNYHHEFPRDFRHG